MLRTEKERERQRLSAAKRRNEDREAYNAYMREWNAKHRDEINAKRRAKLKNDPIHAEKLRSRDRKRHADNPDKTRHQNLKGLYGISLDSYDAMYRDQGGKCLICGEEYPSRGKSCLVVDHCHSSGDIRGLLCGSCNMALGQFKDDISRLQSAVKYLERRTSWL